MSTTGDQVQDPDNLVELAALERMILRSDGFRIAFAVANHPTLRTRLIRAVRRDLPDLTIVELVVPGDPVEMIPAIEAAARPPPGAIFVLGLDELKSDKLRSRVIADLNVNRDYLSRTVSVPVVLWASDFAFRGFAQQAADLWAGRSGMYRFRAEGNDFASTIADITDRINWGPNPDDRRERERLLEDLLDESGDNAKNRALVLIAFGNGSSVQNRYDEAREFYRQALAIYRDIGDRTGEASTLRSLGGTARAQSRFYEAREFYDQALAIYRDIGDRAGEAGVLDSLAGAAGEQSHYYAERTLPAQRNVGLPERRITQLADSGRGTLGGKVFLSYASGDRALAGKVHEWLVDAGFQVFLDQDLRDGIAVGEEWEKRLRWADAVVCVVTSAFLASPRCAYEVGYARSRGSRLLPVRAEPGVDHPLLGSTQYVDISEDPAAGRAALVAALSHFNPVGGRGWPDDRSPFPGLRPFAVDEDRVFFGRSGEVAQLAGLLRSPAEQAVLLVVGPSGCGKSSLVRAGLLPVMAAEPGWWTLLPMLPGNDPVAALARELAAAARWIGLDWTVADIWHRLDYGGLAGLADELLLAARARRLLLVVDQFEELLTQSRPGERARFAHLLRPALGGSLQVVATLRPEFLEQLLLDSELAVLPTHTYTLRPLQRDALLQVIEGPAELAGIGVDEDLVARLVADTGSGEALPLLAFTLAQLAYGVGRGGRLSAARYEQLGGVQGALIRQADAALADASATTGRSDTEVIAGLLRLVTVDEQGRPIRWRVPRDELPEPVTRELEAFITRRLVITDTENGKVVVGVAHEAILSAWAPLAQAIEENVAALRARRAVEQAATEWSEEGRSPSRLWERGQLAFALADTGAHLRAGDLATDRVELSPAARTFLRASIRRNRYRLGRAITVLSVLLVLAVAAASIAFLQRRTAEQERNLALSRQVAIQSLELRTTDPALAAQLGLAAYRLAPTTEARSSLLSALAIPYSTRLTAHAAAVTSVAFSPDGHTLATASIDETVRLWDVSDPHHPTLLGILTGYTVTLVAFSPDGHTLATASADRTVRLWDISDPHHPTPLGIPTGYTAAVTSVAFSPNGNTLATGSYDNTARLWDINDPHHPVSLGVLTGYTDTVTSVVFSPDGHTLATGSADRTVRLWDISNLRQLHPLDTLVGYTGSVTGVVFSPDGHTLATASADNTVRLWDLPGPILAGHTAVVTSVAFSPNGNTLATASADRTVRLWDISDPHHPTPLGILTGYTAAVTSVAFSPNGQILATGGADKADKTVQLWNISDPHHPTPLGILTGHTATVTSVAFSPNGNTLATGSYDHTTRLWDVSDPHHPTLLRVLTGHTDTVTSVAFSPDGHTLATASADRTVQLWDISDLHHPTPLGILTGHTATVTSVAFSPDGHTLATGSADRTVRLWDISDPHHPTPLGILTGHTDTVTSVAFSPNGNTLATGSYDNTTRLWEISNPHRPHSLATLTGHTGSVMGVAFSPDRHTLATANTDATARLWDINVDRVAAQVCSVTPTITKNEWDRYLPGLPYRPPCP